MQNLYCISHFEWETATWNFCIATVPNKEKMLRNIPKTCRDTQDPQLCG